MDLPGFCGHWAYTGASQKSVNGLTQSGLIIHGDEIMEETTTRSVMPRPRGGDAKQ